MLEVENKKKISSNVKVFFHITIFISVFVAMYFFLLRPQLEQAVSDLLLKNINISLGSLSGAVSAPLATNDIMTVHDQVNAFFDNHKEISQILVYLDEKQVYPLQQYDLMDKMNHSSVSVVISGEAIGKVTACFDLKKEVALRIKKISQVFFILFSLALVFYFGQYFLLYTNFIKPTILLAEKLREIIREKRIKKIEIKGSSELIELSSFIYDTIVELDRKQQQEITRSQRLEVANKKLFNAEKKLTTMLGSLTEGVVLFDKGGKILYANSAVYHLFKFSSNEITKKSIDLLIRLHKNISCREWVNSNLDAQDISSDLKNQVLSATAVRKDGSTYPIEFAVRAISINEQALLLGIIRDVTEQIKNEKIQSGISKIQARYISGASLAEISHACSRFILSVMEGTYGFAISSKSVFQKGSTVEVSAVVDISNENYVEKTIIKTVDSVDSLVARCFLGNKQAFFVSDVTEKDLLLFPDNCPEVKNVMALPITIYGQVGIVFFVANKAGVFDHYALNDAKYIASIFSAIFESIIAKSKLEYVATIDALTGAFNRFYFKSHITEVLRVRKSTKSEKFCLMLLDLDKFKEANDFYGHSAGDYILCELVARVRRVVKARDLIARLGGDEFCVYISSISDYAQAGDIAIRILDAANKPYFFQGQKIISTLSIGIACYPASGEDIEELLKHADLSLYQAKKSPKHYSFFSQSLEDDYIYKLNTDKLVEEVIEKEDFYFYFQPIIDTLDNTVAGFESLLRTHDIGLNTEEFISRVESLRLTSKLNVLVCKKVLSFLESVSIKDDKRLFVSFNFSPLTSNIEENIFEVCEAVKRSSAAKRFNIFMEVTESDFDSSMSGSKSISKLLADAEIKLSLDDFGTRYSTITRLIEWDFQTIKIDKSITQMVDSNYKEKVGAIFRAIVLICDCLSIKLVAEGVETEAQLAFVKAAGIRYVQGYYYYKPMPIEELKNLLN